MKNIAKWTWWLQRVTTVVIGLVIVKLGLFFGFTDEITHAEFVLFMSPPIMKYLFLTAVACISIHGYIGMRGIADDYLNQRALGSLSPLLRNLFVFGVLIMSILFTVWAFLII